MRRYFLLVASFSLLLGLLITAWQESRHPKPIALTPTLTGQVEYCLTCHADLAEISSSHPVNTFGCVLCHGGELLALDANLAHSTMRGGKNPSDFSVVLASCGGTNCHSGTAENSRNHIQRVTTSIQATYAGAIANIRYTFGVQPDLKAVLGEFAIRVPESTSGITELAAFNPTQETNPFVQAFGHNCLTCHLSALPLTGSEYIRYTGCSACHTPTQSPDRTDTEKLQSNQIHKLTTAIIYTQCDTCHNRGNYNLRTMTFEPRQDLPIDRLHDYYQPIAQFTSCEWMLDCVDCHTRTEAMGDGNLYSVKKDIQYLQCKTCHGTLTDLPQTRTLTDPNDLAFRLVLLNPVIDLNLGDTLLITEKDEPLWNIRVLPDGTYELFGKADGQRYVFRPVKGSACLQDPDRQDSGSCHECHSVER
ncbi:MAG: hypothetical protein WC832_01660 [Anaerolineales bacterium]